MQKTDAAVSYRVKVSRREGRTGPLPLSKAHISPRVSERRENKGYYEDPNAEYGIVIEGNNVVFVTEDPRKRRLRQLGLSEKAWEGNDVKPWVGGKRGKVTEFTRASRRRLLRHLGGVDWDWAKERGRLLVFVTLTYPNEFPTALASKRDLDVFNERLRRAFPDAFGFWKLEPQKRGAPHYHLLLAIGEGLGSSRNEHSELLEKLESWIPRAWCEVVGSDDAKHFWYHEKECKRVVNPVRSSRGVMCYAAKYVGKPAEDRSESGDWAHTGRWWGVINREGLGEFVKARCLRLNRQAWVMIRRLFRRVAPEGVRRSQAARRVGTWFTFDRTECANAWGGSFLLQALGYAIPGQLVIPPDKCVDLSWHFT